MAATWMDGKQHIATAKDIDARWGGWIGFGCALCGIKFQVGDTYRWVYMNDKSPSPGNFLVCVRCDHPGLCDEVRASLAAPKANIEPWVLRYQLHKANELARRNGGGR